MEAAQVGLPKLEEEPVLEGKKEEAAQRSLHTLLRKAHRPTRRRIEATRISREQGANGLTAHSAPARRHEGQNVPVARDSERTLTDERLTLELGEPASNGRPRRREKPLRVSESGLRISAISPRADMRCENGPLPMEATARADINNRLRRLRGWACVLGGEAPPKRQATAEQPRRVPRAWGTRRRDETQPRGHGGKRQRGHCRAEHRSPPNTAV